MKLESDMFIYSSSAALKGYVTRFGPQSRCGDKLLEIRVRYKFLYSSSAALEGYVTRIGRQAVLFRGQLTRN